MSWRRSGPPNSLSPGESTDAVDRRHSLSHRNCGIQPRVATALSAKIQPLAALAFWPWANMERRTFGYGIVRGFTWLERWDLAVRPLDTWEMLQRLDRFAGKGSEFTQTHVASPGIIDWPAVVDAWQILGETDPTECPSACLVSTWKPATRRDLCQPLAAFCLVRGLRPRGRHADMG